MEEYRYLIGLIMTRANGFGYGRVDVIRTEPITCDQDVNSVERDLRDHFADPALTVLSFSRYTDPSPEGR